jgi:hypothetical protein
MPSLAPLMKVLDIACSLATDVMSRHRMSHVIWSVVPALPHFLRLISSS